jgi:hypothetical protein
MRFYGGGFGRERHTLFSDGRLDDFLTQRTKEALADADRHDSNALVSTETEKLVDFFVQKYGLTLPTLHEKDDEISGDQQETEADARSIGVQNMFFRGDEPTMVPATAFTFTVVFDGDADLFRYAGNTFGPEHPQADVGESELTFQYTIHNPDSGTVQTRLRKDINQTKFWLNDIANQVNTFNKELKAKLHQRITERKSRLGAAQQAAKGLPYKMRVRDDAPKTYAAPEVRRKVALKPPVPKPGAEPEPVMLEENYEHILTVCSSMARVLELSPKAFVDMEEETLRSHFLVQLNGHYLGDATGETFNYQGKTDILVKSNGRNIFIGECKIWKGEKVMIETIDQILGYTSWRDTKTAILLFNRNKDFSAILRKAVETVKQHKNFKAEVTAYKKETAFRFTFTHRDDPERELTLTVMGFNVPT